MSSFQRVCMIDEIRPGGGGMFVVGETAIAVFNLGGDFYALANECPHAGASLAHGEMNGDCVSCRIHHWRFSILDGTYLDEDKPRYNAKCFPTRIVGDQLQVRLDE